METQSCSRTHKTHIQFFIVVVEKDELRVSAGDVFHHQVVAEKVTESQGRQVTHGEQNMSRRCGRILEGDVLHHEGFDLQTQQQISAAFHSVLWFCKVDSVKAELLSFQFCRKPTVWMWIMLQVNSDPCEAFECRQFDSISYDDIINPGTEYTH